MVMEMVMVMDWRKQNLNETLQQICVGNTVVHVCECVWGPILILVGTDPCSGTHLPTKLYLPPYEGRMIPGHHVQHRGCEKYFFLQKKVTFFVKESNFFFLKKSNFFL